MDEPFELSAATAARAKANAAPFALGEGLAHRVGEAQGIRGAADVRGLNAKDAALKDPGTGDPIGLADMGGASALSAEQMTAGGPLHPHHKLPPRYVSDKRGQWEPPAAPEPAPPREREREHIELPPPVGTPARYRRPPR